MPEPLTRSAKARTKQALVEMIRRRPNLSDVQVSYAWPAKTAEAEGIWCGKASGSMSIAGMRADRKARTEEFALDVLAEVIGEGMTQEEADERALFLAAEVEDVVADDPTLDGLLLKSRVEGHELDGGFTDNGHGARVRLAIRCTARLE